MRYCRRFFLGALVVLVLAVSSVLASADQIAVFGNNNLYNVINLVAPGTAVLVTDGQLATPGFLSSYNAVLITRDGGGFGVPLSPGAASNVSAFVGSGFGEGNVVLFAADWADIVGLPGAPSVEDSGGNPDATQAFLNAVNWAMANHGYIGEFNGGVMGLSSNSDGFNVLGFVTGNAGSLNCGYLTTEAVNVAQPGHPVVAGVSGTFNTNELSCRSSYDSVDPANVLAYFGNGDPAIVVNNVPAIPEPGSVVLLGTGLAGLITRKRHK